MVDVRLTYDKGLDTYYGLLDIAEKYFTKEIMEKIEESVGKEFRYG